jgi:ParB family chromosome partitioning protein
MAAGFSVKDALNKNSKAGIDESPRARFRTKDISIFKMYRNDMNFYSVEQIEELAGDILMYGLKQNLELVYAPCEMGEYRIVAGERRWEALKYLVSKGYKEFELATSKLTTPQDDDEEQVEIIIANAYRTKTVSDMIEEETRLKASLERMKAAGKKIKGYDLQSGRLREVISSMLHMSKTKVAQIEAVNNNLIPEWKEELKGERLTFSAAYELSGMTEDEQREALGKFTETGELTHKDVKDMKAERAAGQQVSESDTETEIGMNPPEVRAGDEYETPHPEGITSICYSCTEYETCNVKTGTCTSCDQYKNRTEAYKTDEQRYSEEQDAIDRETKKKLREMEQEEKMKNLPSDATGEIKSIRVSKEKFEEYTGEHRKPYMITKDDGFKVGNVVKLVVFAAGKATGETADMRITCKDDDITCSGLSDGWCVIGLGEA